MTPQNRIAEIEARCNRATASPSDCPSCHGARPNMELNWSCKECCGANVNFKAAGFLLTLHKHYRTDIPFLLQLIRTQELALTRAVDAFGLIADRHGDWTEAFMRKTAVDALAEIAKL